MGGKPTPLLSKTAARKRVRQSASRTSTLNGGAAKRQRKSGGRRSGEADASATKKNLVASNDDDDLTSPDPDDYTDILGPDEWKPPRASSGAWEDSVKTVETVETDNDGVLWVFLSWNEKSEDGRFLRNKAKASLCYKACPQKVCFHSVLTRSSRNSLSDLDVEILRKPSVSSSSNLSLFPH